MIKLFYGTFFRNFGRFTIILGFDLQNNLLHCLRIKMRDNERSSSN